MESPVESNSSSPEYLIQLLKDKRQLQVLPACFLHVERLLDDEINRVRGNVLNFGLAVEPLQLPEPIGNVVTLHEKLTIPVNDHPDFNFVGRLLGPRGMTAKQLELETGCKILIRGRGSMRDKHKEDLMRGKSKWEHLNEDLHVLVSVEDTKNRATIKLQRAVDEVKKLLVPSPESEDELKKRQLMELALLNGTYRGFQNNNNNNNILTTNGPGYGVFMMAAPQFCSAGGLPNTAVLPPAGLSVVPTSAGAQLTAFPVLMSPEHAGAPIFLTTPPPLMSSSAPSLTSPTGLSPSPLISPDICKMTPLPPPTPNHQSNGGVFYHHHHSQYDHLVGSTANGGMPMSGHPTQAMFEIPIVSLAGSGNDFCRANTAINMVAAPTAAYVH